MLKYGNKEFRNLEEQVLQNKEDIARLKTGPISAATLVYVNGEAVGIWDADTKVSSYVGAPTYNLVYGRGASSSTDKTFKASDTPEFNSLVLRDANGCVRTRNPLQATDAINLGYLNNRLYQERIPTYAHRITIKPKTGGRTTSGETMSSFHLDTTIYNNTTTPLTFDEVYYGTDKFSNLINTMAWTGEFNRDSYTSGSQLCKILGWRRGTASNGYPLQLVCYRWTSPSAPFTIAYTPDQLQVIDTVYSYDT